MNPRKSLMGDVVCFVGVVLLLFVYLSQYYHEVPATLSLFLFLFIGNILISFFLEWRKALFFGLAIIIVFLVVFHFFDYRIILLNNLIIATMLPLLSVWASRIGKKIRMQDKLNAAGKEKNISLEPALKEEITIEKKNECIHQLKKEIAQSIRYDNPLSLGMVEIKNQQKYPGSEGEHSMTKRYYAALDKGLRTEDSIYYLGEGIFAIIFPHTDFESTYIIKKRIRKDLEEMSTTGEGEEIFDIQQFVIAMVQMDEMSMDPYQLIEKGMKELEYEI